MKRWSTSLAAREIQIKTTRYLYTSRIGSVPQIHPPFLQQSALCVLGKWRVGGITKYSHSILPGRRVCSEPVFAQSRGPLGCHRVCKASFCGLKKSQQIMELHFSFQIRRPGTRDHKGLIQSHTALTLTHLLIPLWMWWVLGWGPAQDQSCSSS